MSQNIEEFLINKSIFIDRYDRTQNKFYTEEILIRNIIYDEKSNATFDIYKTSLRYGRPEYLQLNTIINTIKNNLEVNSNKVLFDELLKLYPEYII